MFRIFISSVQKEFAAERVSLAEFIAGDALLGRQFETFVFEKHVPAKDRRADAVYLDELSRCQLYIGLFGNEYGWENADGLSPTHLEFAEANRLGIPRLIYVKGTHDRDKHEKMQALIREAGNQVIRRRFNSFDELRTAVYASLVDHLEVTGVIQSGPWDASTAKGATLQAIDEEALGRFVRRARKARNFSLPETAEVEEILAHLNLLEADQPTHAAVLLFGKQPQRFVRSSEVKCAHFHGTEVAKPIPSYQVHKGTAFDLVDQAVDFVLSKIDVRIGTRAESTAAPVGYEIPREVVREAIVNAVAHRDYRSTASVQVMLFADRLEVWNPGTLPPSLTLEKLGKRHGSFPANPLLAEPLYLAQYIERLGTGTRDMIRLCEEAGLEPPQFALTDGFVVTIQRPVTQSAPSGQQVGTKSGPSRDQVGTKSLTTGTKLILTGDQVLILRKALMKNGIQELMEVVSRSNRTKFRDQVLRLLLDEDLLEMTIPDKPTSSKQQYRTTEKGRLLLESLDADTAPPNS